MSSQLSNLGPFSGIFNLGNNQKSQGAWQTVGNYLLGQENLDQMQRMGGDVVMMQLPVAWLPQVRSLAENCIKKMMENLLIILFLTVWAAKKPYYNQWHPYFGCWRPTNTMVTVNWSSVIFKPVISFCHLCNPHIVFAESLLNLTNCFTLGIFFTFFTYKLVYFGKTWLIQ